jgi:elongation factor P--(R)-beta-lysine ligase
MRNRIARHPRPALVASVLDLNMARTGMSLPVLMRVQMRHRALQCVRRWFVERGFLEVDAPLLLRCPGLEPHIDPVAVQLHRRPDVAAEARWLSTSPEYAMKKLLAQLDETVPGLVSMGHVFRDGETTQRHRSEFTMIEWYKRAATLPEMMTATMELLRALANETSLRAFFDANRVQAAQQPAHMLSVSEACRSVHIDIDAALTAMRGGDDQALVKQVAAAGFALRPGADFEDAFFAVMARVEEQLPSDRVTIIHRWPAQMAVLARTCSDDDRYAERFEMYAGGLELCNAYDELTDAQEQRARFQQDQSARRMLGKDPLQVDEELLAALPSLPRCSGNALGFDRVLMWLCGTTHIQDVLVFDDEGSVVSP